VAAVFLVSFAGIATSAWRLFVPEVQKPQESKLASAQ
jgi:hypothetical protein